MKKYYHKLFKSTLSTTLTVVLALLVSVCAVWGTTTIGTNISTTGTTSMSTASTTGDFWLGNLDTNDDDYLYMDASSTEYLMWNNLPGQFELSDDLLIDGNATSTGNLVVGTGSVAWGAPTSTLTVDGSGYFTGNLSVSGNATTSGTSFVSGRATTSSHTVLGGAAPVAGATTTITFGSIDSGNTQGLCLKFFTGGATIYCYLGTAVAAAATSGELWCTTASCE